EAWLAGAGAPRNASGTSGAAMARAGSRRACRVGAAHRSGGVVTDRGAHLILGISDSHDAGVALLRGGRILAALNEERLSRKKMAARLAIRCLEEIWWIAGVSPQEVTRVAVAGRSSLGTPPLNNDFTDDDGRAGVALQIAEAIDRLPLGPEVLASPGVNAIYRRVMQS